VKIHSSGLLLTSHGVKDITHASRYVNAMHVVHVPLHDDRTVTPISPAVTTCITDVCTALSMLHDCPDSTGGLLCHRAGSLAV